MGGHATNATSVEKKRHQETWQATLKQNIFLASLMPVTSVERPPGQEILLECISATTIEQCFWARISLVKTQSQLVCSFQSQGVSKILRACRNFGKVNG